MQVESDDVVWLHAAREIPLRVLIDSIISLNIGIASLAGPDSLCISAAGHDLFEEVVERFAVVLDFWKAVSTRAMDLKTRSIQTYRLLRRVWLCLSLLRSLEHLSASYILRRDKHQWQLSQPPRFPEL